MLLTLYTIYRTGIDAGRGDLQADPRAGAERAAVPVEVEAPEGWRVAECNGGTLEVYDPRGDHAAVIDRGSHVQAVTGGGSTRLRVIRRADFDAVAGRPRHGPAARGETYLEIIDTTSRK